MDDFVMQLITCLEKRSMLMNFLTLVCQAMDKVYLAVPDKIFLLGQIGYVCIQVRKFCCKSLAEQRQSLP